MTILKPASIEWQSAICRSLPPPNPKSWGKKPEATTKVTLQEPPKILAEFVQLINAGAKSTRFLKFDDVPGKLDKKLAEIFYVMHRNST